MYTAILAAVALATSSHALIVRSACPDGVNTAINPACCPFFSLRDAIIDTIFEGVCGENAHSAVRIAFHDANGFSTTDPSFGDGADGSIIAFQDIELGFGSNNGIADIIGDLQPFADANGLTYGDVIQFSSSVALSLCPGAPIVQTFFGRPNATRAAIDHTLPDPFQSVDEILARMADAGFSPAELVALLASHSIAAQDKVEEATHGSPFDSTPDQFDSQVFLETLLTGTQFPGTSDNLGEAASGIDGEFRLASDGLLARDPRTACTWQSFVSDQALMARSFAAAMGKLAVLGQDVSLLTDCTEVISPAAAAANGAAFFPAGSTPDDIEASCADTPFPTDLVVNTGDPIVVARVPPQ